MALCWFARETETPAANRLVRSRTDLVAPSFLLAVLANGFWKKICRGEMRADIAVDAIKKVRRFVPLFVDLSEFAAQAFELARKIDHSVYDCCYLAVALRRVALSSPARPEAGMRVSSCILPIGFAE